MSGSVAAKAVLVWLVILALAVLNGLLREALLIPNLGAVPGTVTAGVLLCGIVFAATYLLLPRVGARGVGQFLAIGAAWLVLTLVFEVSFGLSQGVTLATMLTAYTFTGGNLWPIVLLVTAVSPWLVARLRGLR